MAYLDKSLQTYLCEALLPLCFLYLYTYQECFQENYSNFPVLNAHHTIILQIIQNVVRVSLNKEMTSNRRLLPRHYTKSGMSTNDTASLGCKKIKIGPYWHKQHMFPVSMLYQLP